MNQVILVQEEPMVASELIEILVTAAAAGTFNVPLPETQQLKSDTDQTVIVKAIRLVTVEVLSRGVVSGLVNAPVTELQKISITLYSQGWQKGHNIPILTLNDTTIPGGTAPHRYHQQKFNDWRKIDWTQCYLQYSNGSGGVVTGNYCVMLQVDYVRLNAAGAVIQGPNP